jgi:deoxyribodipyrimidine photo-lyase
MNPLTYKKHRIHIRNEKPILREKAYILYWMQAYRRFSSNHSLDYAIAIAKELGKELIVYEGLRMDYPWSSKRIHQFIMEGMVENQKDAKNLNINYWCYVETPNQPAQGLLKKISEKAALIITDDFPCFIIPEQTEKLAKKIDCQLVSVDGNGIIPLDLYGEHASSARVLRIRMHKLVSEAYVQQAITDHKPQTTKHLQTKPPFTPFSCEEKDIDRILQSIPFPNQVAPFYGTKGGRKEALRLLDSFLVDKLSRYDTDRSHPNRPEHSPVSLLSPYLHFGHISAEEIISSVLNKDLIDEKWAPDLLNIDFRGKREGYFSNQNYINSFLDELITWRDIGFLLFWKNPSRSKGLEELPNWAKENFNRHRNDKREYNYSLEEWKLGQTHDPIWNAGQKELYHTGRMQNYIRMLWGKKIIEWSPSPEEAFATMEELNNLYAYDGRNPNSYTGILWCFGMFDRPWFPERNVLGNVRYMSSDSTKKKFKLGSYLDYVASLTSHQESLF